MGDERALQPLEALTQLARRAGSLAVAREASSLSERIADRRFYLAVVGQFKRGKSSLINALLGEAVLPTGVVPVTSLVTVVRHGPRSSARIRGAGDCWQDLAIDELPAYVSEAQNPGNTKGVLGVEVFSPSALLASGMCLVDTPGVGSVFRGGSEVTRAFVPHVDAALVVLGADPPISEEELELVAMVANHVDRLIFVLNKADRVSAADLQEAKAFTVRVVGERLGQVPACVYEISATERLSCSRTRRDWDALHATLQKQASEAGSALVESAERRGFELLRAQLQKELQEQHAALCRPIAESETRVERLRRCVADAERALQELGYLWNAEQDRLKAEFAARSQNFIARATGQARVELRTRLGGLSGSRAGQRRAAIEAAQGIAKDWLDRWHREEEPAAEALYQSTAERFVDLADQLLQGLAATSDSGVLPTQVGPQLGFRVRSRLYYHDQIGTISRSPWQWLVDTLRPPESARRAVERRVSAYLDKLLFTNTLRIENDFNERVLESRRRLEQELRSRLSETVAAAERALAQSRSIQAAGAAVVEAELSRLDGLLDELEALGTASRDAT